MGDVTSLIGKGVDFMSDRIAERKAAQQRDIDRAREDEYNAQQQKNWQTQFDENQMIDRRNFQYQKELNDMQMRREDNATQRKVADLQAAGMNKLLAVGQEAASGGMTTYGGNAFGGNAGGSVSEFSNEGFMSKGARIMDDLVKQSMIGKTQAETEYTAQKTLTEFEETAKRKIEKLREKIAKEKDEYMRKSWEKEIEQIEADIDLKRANAGLSKVERDTKQWDLDKSKYEGLRTNDAKDSKYNSGVAAANAAANTAKKITEAAMDGEEIKSRKDDKFKDEWDEGIHRNQYGEVIYEVFWDKRNKKWKRVWKNGKSEYKGY